MPFQMPEIRQSNALQMIGQIRQQRMQNALAEQQAALQERQLGLTEAAQRRQQQQFDAEQQTAAQERQRAALADVFNAVEQGKTPERAMQIGAQIMQSPEWQARFGQGGDVLAQRMLSQPEAWKPENIRASAAAFGIRLRSQELADMAAEARVKRAPTQPQYRMVQDANRGYVRVDLGTGERTDLGFSAPAPAPPAPVSVTYQAAPTTLVDPATGQPVLGRFNPKTGGYERADVPSGLAPAPPSGANRNATTLRNEYLRETREYRDRVGAYRQIEALSGGGAVNDRALVIALMKVYDPTSVVREGEQAMMSNAGGAPEWVRNTYNKMLTGESLTPEQRAAMVQSARALVESQRPSYDAVTSEYRRLALEGGLEPSQVIVDTVTPRPRPNAAKPRAAGTPSDPVHVTTRAEALALPPGTVFLDPNTKKPRVR